MKNKHYRPVMLERLNGRILSAPSIAAFCRAARLGKNAQFHISPIIHGKRASYRGWYLPHTLSARLSLVDIYGNEVTGSFAAFVKKHGLKSPSVFALLKGRRTKIATRGVALSSASFGGAARPNPLKTVSCVIRGKRGRVIRAANLSQAAKKAGLEPSAFYAVAYGLQSSAKGYRVVSVIQKRRAVLS